MNSKEFFHSFGKLLYNIDGFYSIYAKKYNVKENELWILYALDDGKEHSQIDISENWDIPKTTINTIIKQLEKEKYVELMQIKGEKRTLHIKLTNIGKEYANQLLSDLYKLEEKLYKSFSFNCNDLLNELNEIKEKLYLEGKVNE